MRLSSSIPIVFTICAALNFVPGVSFAQHNHWIEAAHRYGEQADFEAALQAFERAQREGGLSRLDVVELLTTRPIIHHALGDDSGMRLDLACLAALEPNYEFGPEVLPQVRTAFASLRLEVEPLRLDLALQLQPNGLEISAQYGHPPPQLVLEDRVYARISGQSWRVAPQRISIANPERKPVEYFAEALGPGGALLIARGSRDTPLRFEYEQRARADDARADTLPWILGGAALLVAGVTVAIVAAMSQSDHTRFEGPLVR